MRHLHTPAGVSDPDLTSEGQAYAKLLAKWFEKHSPTLVYVSSAKRAQQTVEPLAKRFGLVPIIYDPKDTPGLIRRVRVERGTVLIVGHSNTVPDIIDQLGGQRPAPIQHPDFADVWLVQSDTGATFRWKLPAPAEP
jgi:broad specificity phosphatase PhoE